MEITVNLLIRNDRPTIERAVESVLPLGPAALQAADLGGDDGTAAWCRSRGVRVFPFRGSRGDAVNMLSARAPTEWQFYLKPNEFLLRGHDSFGAEPGGSAMVAVLRDSILWHETRLWSRDRDRFHNPVYESARRSVHVLDDVVLSHSAPDDAPYNLELVRSWRRQRPLDRDALYFEAMTLLSLGRFDEYARCSKEYLFACPQGDRSALLRYYNAVALFRNGEANAALYSLAFCLAEYPLMAEFWCLAADVYYHLLSGYKIARDLYQNAVSLGAGRRPGDGMPMDIGKYKKYPELMIASCDTLTAGG